MVASGAAAARGERPKATTPVAPSKVRLRRHQQRPASAGTTAVAYAAIAGSGRSLRTNADQSAVRP